MVCERRYPRRQLKKRDFFAPMVNSSVKTIEPARLGTRRNPIEVFDDEEWQPIPVFDNDGWHHVPGVRIPGPNGDVSDNRVAISFYPDLSSLELNGPRLLAPDFNPPSPPREEEQQELEEIDDFKDDGYSSSEEQDFQEGPEVNDSPYRPYDEEVEGQGPLITVSDVSSSEDEEGPDKMCYKRTAIRTGVIRRK